MIRGLLRMTVLASAGVLGACAGVTVPPTPLALPAPVVDDDLVEVVGELAPPPFDPSFLAPPPEPLPRVDAILDSPLAGHPGLEARVSFWIQRWQRRGVFDLPVSLGRMGYYQEAVERELDARGLPRSLQYLPVIESGYHAAAVSGVGASGLWQLMGPTARSLGLNVNTLVDERFDPFSATPVALDYLEEMYDRFGSWFLALAAYNAGPYRVESILRRHAPDAPLDDATFWRIRNHLPAETRDFVPKFLAAARVGEDPEAHGFEVTRSEPLVFEEVAVSDATTVDVLARAAESPQDLIEQLNPQLLRGLTPVGVPTTIRVPLGKGPVFAENWSRIPEDERVSFVEHRISSGETLSAIASVYRVRLADLQAANPGLNPRRLRIGQAVVIPRIPTSSGNVVVASAAAAPLPEPAPVQARGGDGGDLGTAVVLDRAVEPREIEHRVAPGESFWTIARRYGVSMADLRDWNGMAQNHVLKEGERLQIRTGGEAVPAGSQPRVHVVRSGDTLGTIAQRYGVGPDDLAAENGLTGASILRPGDRLRVPGGN